MIPGSSWCSAQLSYIAAHTRSPDCDCLQEEAKALVDSGVVELNLIAEDTNQYGQDRCGQWW